MFRIIEDEKEFNRLWQLRGQMIETRDKLERLEIMSQLIKDMRIDASTVRDARAKINLCLDKSNRRLWIKENGIQIGDEVLYGSGPAEQVAVVLKFSESLREFAKDAVLSLENGRSNSVSAYTIRPMDREAFVSAFLERLRGTQQQKEG